MWDLQHSLPHWHIQWPGILTCGHASLCQIRVVWDLEAPGLSLVKGLVGGSEKRSRQTWTNLSMGGGVYSTATKDDSCSPSIFQPYPSYRRCSDDKPEVDGACRGASKNSLKTLLEVGAAWRRLIVVKPDAFYGNHAGLDSTCGNSKGPAGMHLCIWHNATRKGAITL